MKRGQRPKPTVLKQLARTIRSRDRQRGPEPVAVGYLADLAPPAHLSEAQLARWVQALRDAPASVLRKIDAEALTTFVLAGDILETANRAQQKIDQRGELPLLVKGDKGTMVPSPYIRIIRWMSAAVLRSAAELGFSPAARAGMATDPNAADRDDDGWSEFKWLQRRANEEDTKYRALAAAKPPSPEVQ
jgi:phage terminase small subunit